eukprot:435769-Prymnesium_polylepis.1
MAGSAADIARLAAVRDAAERAGRVHSAAAHPPLAPRGAAAATGAPGVGAERVARQGEGQPEGGGCDRERVHYRRGARHARLAQLLAARQ